MTVSVDLSTAKPETPAGTATLAHTPTHTPDTTEPALMPQELIFEASQQVTIRCGKSSITLYPNGKIALRGEYIVSDAEGVNRIVGGQIELN
ncbi:hypothetical protein OU995_05745 [Roseateles sp. SL47]|uniref:hypothetical protein n=1 Tax=Roseateles sp. SL47 TaxID=2995138 RepID=UPI00226DDCD6|nr:hypothetical protein [Roseateles sp. SL47]WAC74229.1 hypothetical protein OU995_05745 [Roseateles sp. SL47]